MKPQYTLDTLYDRAVAAAGESPNVLGFMRRVRTSKHYRAPGRNIGGYNSDADDAEIRQARALLQIAARCGRW